MGPPSGGRVLGRCRRGRALRAGPLIVLDTSAALATLLGNHSARDALPGRRLPHHYESAGRRPRTDARSAAAGVRVARQPARLRRPLRGGRRGPRRPVGHRRRSTGRGAGRPLPAGTHRRLTQARRQQDDERRRRVQGNGFGDEQHQRDQEDREHAFPRSVQVRHVDEQRNPEQSERYQQSNSVQADELEARFLVTSAQ